MEKQKTDPLEARREYGIKRLKNKFLALLAMHTPFLPSKYRARVHKLRGVHFDNVKTNFVGPNVHLDDMYPDKISIGRNTIITDGVKILTHYIDTKQKSKDTGEIFRFYKGQVRIEENVFIGTNTVITKSVTIGNNSIIGANSVVTRDIPPNSLVVGNPGKIIRKIFKDPES